MTTTIADVVAYEVAYFRKKNRVTVGSPAKLAPSMKLRAEANELWIQRGIMRRLAGASRSAGELYTIRRRRLYGLSHENPRCLYLIND